MTALMSIFIGVVSGVLTATFLWLLSRLYQNTFLPWFQSVLYPGIIVEGPWQCKDASLNQEIYLEITQKANILTGKATLIAKMVAESHYEKVRTFNMIGKINDRFVVLQSTNDNKKRLGINTFLLEVKGDGRRLIGAFSYYSVGDHKINSCDVALVQNSCPEPTKETKQFKSVPKPAVSSKQDKEPTQ